MSQITRRQHYVPKFYLTQWAQRKGKIARHDLLNNVVTSPNPAKALLQRYYYEEDPNSPDNRIENVLGNMESASAPIFKKIADIHQSISSDKYGKQFADSLKKQLTDEDLDSLSQFAAYQYLRVPGAIDQKKFELQPSGLTETEINQALNPGKFVESGYSYIKDRFKSMNIFLMVSPSREFITSDWPCFDMKDSNDSPLLGEEIGGNSEVVCYLPLSPKVGAIFYHPNFSKKSPLVPRLIVVPQTDVAIRNQNTLVIQKASQFVIASQEEKFIFQISAKRKKATSTN